MPLKLRLLSTVLLISTVSMTFSPMDESHITLTLLYWLIKGCMCFTLSIAIEVCWESIFSTKQRKPFFAIMLVGGEWLIVAIILTIIDIPLESILPVAMVYNEVFSWYEFIEECLIHWVALSPLLLLSILTKPQYDSLREALIRTTPSSQQHNHSLESVNSAPMVLPDEHLDQSSTSEIIRIEAAEHYVLVYYQHGKEMVKSSFGTYLKKLNVSDGMQIHRSHWINVNHVNKLGRTGRKLYIHMKNGDKLPVSNSFKDMVLCSLAHVV